MITLKINNRVVEVEDGSTILQAAKKLGIFIPRLFLCLSFKIISSKLARQTL